MATMLRSAAMTLLSKTLLTFLYKYLSDVDVEGVEMPSLYGSADGTGSGWGVRLSNVKLREGAELMVLPGSRKAKEKPKSSETNETGDDGNSNSTVSSKRSRKKARKLKKREKTSADGPVSNGESSTKDHHHKRQQNEGINGTDTTTRAPTVDARRQKGGSKAKESMHGSKSSANTSSTGMADETLLTDGLDLDLDSDCGSMSSIQEADESTRPETPVQQSGIGFLSCFAPGDAQATKAAKAKISEQREQEANLSSETPSQEEREDESRQFSNGVHSTMNGHGAIAINGDATMNSKDLCDAIQQGIEEQLPEIPDLFDDDDDQDAEDEGDYTVEEEEEEEEDGPLSPPMALRIGEGGYIGTLDVRLVGRELHVLVEDAFLNLEAVTKEATSDEPVASKNSTDAENTTTDLPAAETTDKQPAAATPPPPPVDIDDLKTTGERVLAKNAIARIFSSIPHLYLRDIVVRLIVRSDNSQGSDEDSDEGTATPRTNEELDKDSADVIVDIGIGLLSVTEGDEFSSPFEEADDASTQDEGDDTVPHMSSQTSQLGASPENEYLERRIRTGKGADGGLWLNIVIPKHEKASNDLFAKHKPASVSHSMEHRWARHLWLESTRNCVLRVSGLDIQARIFLGTKKELNQANGSYLWSYDDTSTYEGIDHTLYGFDHVVPGPTPNTLPPLNPAPHCSASRSMEEGDDNGNLRSQVYKTDRNGIQSSQIESCFYRVARGMTPTRCTLEHLPCENCLKCWEASGKRTGEVPDEAHILDSYTPMPGMTLSVSFKDPLELNVDRVSLDGLGLVIGLFKKKADAPEPASGEAHAEPEQVEDTPPVAEVVTDPEASRGYFSSFFFGSTKTEEEETEGRRFSGLLSPRRRKAKPPAFPTYMKPENVQILGVFIAEVRLRVHVMRGDDEEKHNTGRSFCYWDLKGKCLTLDQQKLNSEKKLLSDMRLDLGILELNEFKGVENKILVSAGVPCPAAANEFVTLDSLSSRERGARPPWPTIASALLDIPATLESMAYENRERHGVQLRMLQVTDQPDTVSEKARTLFNCQMGVVEINLPFRIAGVFGEIKSEAMQSLGFKKKEDDPADAAQPKKDSATQYRAQLGGGRVRMNPSLDVRLPLTRFAGNMCPESGFSMETLLERAEVSWGQSSERLVPTANSAKGVSLKRFAGLSEPIRLRILLFLDDLEPLEKALGIKRQSNSFLRCNAVNKGLGKLGAKRTKKKATDSHSSLNKRQQLMNKLLTLDDDALENLWASHQKKQRKVKKTNSVKKAR